MAKPRVKIKKFRVLDWIVPSFGNTHSFPYFHLNIVGENGVEKTIWTKEDGPNTYFTFCRKRYYFVNKGTSFSPRLEILEEGSV